MMHVFKFGMESVAGTGDAPGDTPGNASGQDGLLSGLVFPFSGSFGGPGNKHPVDRKTGEPDLSYALCDGSAHTAPDGAQVQTPDLRGRFVLGAGPGNAAHTWGGAWTVSSAAGGTFHVNSSVTGWHAHSQGWTGGTTLDTNTMPYHSHNLWNALSSMVNGVGGQQIGRGNSANGYTQAAGGSQPHYHSNPNTDGNGDHSHTVTVGDHTHSVTAIPPYYALAYIMKL